MTWFEQLEQRKKLLVGGTILICMAMLLVTARRIFPSYDGFWHLQAGLDWLEHGLSPWLDHFSFTFNGEEIANPPYMFQVLLAWLVKNFGLEPGFQAFRLIGFFSLFGLIVVFLRKLRSPALVYCLVLPLIVILLQFRALARPELLSYSLSVLAIMLYYRTSNELSVAGMLPIIGLMLLWNNYHSPIIGYIIFFGYFVDISLKNIANHARASAWLEWLAWGFTIIAVGFLTPGFNHPLLSLINFSPEWAHHIAEYHAYGAYTKSAAFYVLIIITVITLLLLIIKRQFGLLIVCTVLIFSATTMPRLIAPGGIVILCVFAWIVSGVDLEARLRRLSPSLRIMTGCSALILFMLSIWTGVHLARGFMAENKLTALQYPADVADYMIDHNISGRIFNDYGIGGYLIYRLSPDSEVYIDGRTNILYTIDHFERFLDATGSPEVFRAEVEKYDINLAVLGHNMGAFSLIDDSGMLGLDFMGAKFSLFSKKNPNFPVLGTLLAQPACWNEDLSTALEEEQSKANLILPSYSMLIPFMNFVLSYTGAEDKSAYLGDLEKIETWDVNMLKFAAYQALNHRMYSLAISLFTAINNWQFRDYLANALARAHLEEWKLAEQLLDQATRKDWPNMKLDDLVILHGLLAHIREKAPFELFDDAYVNRLAEQIGADDESLSFPIPDTHSFCQNH